MDSVKISQQLLHSVKTNHPADDLIKELELKQLQDLIAELKEINSRKTFWINLYNAFVQIHIKEFKPDFSSLKSRNNFFSRRSILISNRALSLDDIEHGMLRHSSLKWSFGYLEKILVNDFERSLRLPLDYRIHFALNCGAKSCPAIAFYSAEKIDEQLDDAMKSFLEEDVRFEKRTNTVHISSIFNWYRGDFGGKRGIINLLWSQQLIPAGKKIKLRFTEYDWKTSVGNFL